MKHTVFVDKIGNIFSGDAASANEHFDKYKELSTRGVGSFADKDVYILDENRNIVKSYGKTLFAMGGVTTENQNNLVRNFVIGKKLDNDKISKSGFMALQMPESSVLIYKSDEGERPIIKTHNGSAVFLSNNFSKSDFIDNMISDFKKVCIENAIKFKID